jgi:hypothetical protein
MAMSCSVVPPLTLSGPMTLIGGLSIVTRQ